MAIAWVALGVLLLAVELRHLAFFALFGAAGAFAAALHFRLIREADPVSLQL